MVFYLGTHHPDWLGRAGVPLFVSQRRLAKRRTLPHATIPWALDSGGFSELTLYGQWVTSPADYIKLVQRCVDEVGNLQWAATQDWMCEPHILAKTGLTIAEHQARTISNAVELLDRAPHLPWLPVLQGWHRDDYLRHRDAYWRANVSIEHVGLGSVCRRQHTDEIGQLVKALRGHRLHGFGVKSAGLARYGQMLDSADSLAWSYAGRRDAPLPGHIHKNCANCLEYALLWRSGLCGSLR